MIKRILLSWMIAGTCMGAVNYIPSPADGEFVAWQGGYYLWQEKADEGWTDPNAADLAAIYYMQDTNGATLLIDSSGNGNDATPMPSVATGPTYTNLGARTNASGDEIARGFDEVDDYGEITTPHTIEIGTTNEFTLVAWVYMDFDLDTTSAEHEVLSSARGTGVRFLWRADKDDNKMQFAGWSAGGVLVVNARGNKTSWNANQWYHLAVKRTSAGYTFYVDGVADGFVAETDQIGTTAERMTIGIDSSSALGAPWGGMIDGLRIYQKALSSEDITTLYDNTIHPLGSIENRLTP